MPIFGTDCSDFDWGRGPMDVASMVRDGISFLTAKATEGTSVRHAKYGQAMNRAAAAGMPLMGAYVVPRTPGNNGHGSIQAQVNYFLAYLDSQTPWWRARREFFIQVDLEHWGYDDVAAQHGVEMCRLLRAATGKWVVLYAPRWAYGDSIPGNDPLWASAYGNNPALPYRQAYRGDNDAGWNPYSGRTPVILQYGSATRIGSQLGCDINAYRGSLDELRALITGGHVAGEADAAFSKPYTGTEPWISGQSWVSKALEGPLRDVNRKADAVIKDVAEMKNRPAATVALDADAEARIIDGVAAKLAALIPTADRIAAASADEEAKRLGNG